MADGRLQSSTDEGLSCISLDDLEPRLPPRISQFPIPFTFPEKPKPRVPDVSLIFDSQSPINRNSYQPQHPPQSRQINNPAIRTDYPISANNNNSVNNKPPISNSWKSPPPSDHKTSDKQKDGCCDNTQELKNDINFLVKQVKAQEKTMSRIEEKLDKLMHHLSHKGSPRSKEVQTDNSSPSTSQLEKSSKRRSLKASTEILSSNRSSRGSNSSPPVQTIHRPPITTDSENVRPTKFTPPTRGMKGRLARLRNEGKNDESFSAILKDIQLPNMHEPSVYSETSQIKSLELQEFNDDSFCSGSGSGSDSPILGRRSLHSSMSSEEESSRNHNFHNQGHFNHRVLSNSNRDERQRFETAESYGRSSNPRVTEEEYRRSTGLESSRISKSSNSSGSSTKTPQQQQDESGDEVVEATKKYLEKLGVQFGSTGQKNLNPTKSDRNYMIQQNVYNSFYIPTVNCVPVTPDALDSNANSGNFRAIANKYVSPEELREFDAQKGNARIGPDGSTETTVYGMSPNNLSFATKDYLQRYGLVNQKGNNNDQRRSGRNAIMPPPPSSKYKSENQFGSCNDRILDITAIRNQPKLQ